MQDINLGVISTLSEAVQLSIAIHLIGYYYKDENKKEKKMFMSGITDKTGISRKILIDAFEYVDEYRKLLSDQNNDNTKNTRRKRLPTKGRNNNPNSSRKEKSNKGSNGKGSGVQR